MSDKMVPNLCSSAVRVPEFMNFFLLGPPCHSNLAFISYFIEYLELKYFQNFVIMLLLLLYLDLS